VVAATVEIVAAGAEAVADGATAIRPHVGTAAFGCPPSEARHWFESILG